MTSRERMLAVLNREPVDRVPVDLWLTEEVLAALLAHFGVEDAAAVWPVMGVDKMQGVSAAYVGHSGEVEGRPNCKRTHWGAILQEQQSGAASYDEYTVAPLADYDSIASLEDYPWWPDPAQFDYLTMAAKAKSNQKEYLTLGPWISFFEVYCQLRGLETSMMDLALQPAYVHAVLDKIEELQTGMLLRMLETAGENIDMVFISDDMGAQSSLLLSLDMWDYFFKERMKRWCDLIHDAGKRVFFHSDGAVYDLLPRLVEVGIDVLNPIQHACPGMERERLNAEFGDQLIFHGGVENQQVLPFGTTDEVRKETLTCLRTLGKDGGYLPCSCHNIQAGTPVKNVLAMVEVVQNYTEI